MAPPSVWSGTASIDVGGVSFNARRSQVAGWLETLIASDQVVELRALRVGQTNSTWSGYFDVDHLDDMAEDAVKLTQNAEGVYFTLNPLKEDVLARRSNRTDVAGRGDTASDNDVLRRRWLLVDADPKRSGNISSTDGEKATALEVIKRVRSQLDQRGLPEPILADSGNGYHLLYRIDLPAEDGELVKRVLTALAQRFDTDEVKIDQKVFNPGRIVKLYGTMARKGDSTPERPHRWTEVLDIPKDVQPVSRGQMEALAAEMRQTVIPSRAVAGATAQKGWNREDIKRRARKNLRDLPPAISGQSGHDVTFAAACKLVVGFDLSIDEALPILQDWNETCQPPWSERELRHKLEDAHKQPGGRGYLLFAERPRLDPGVGIDDATTTGTLKPQKQDDDPIRLASVFLQQHTHPDGNRLRFWQGDWYSWNGSRYVNTDDEEVKGDLWTAIGQEFDALCQVGQPGSNLVAKKVTVDLVNNVRGALKSMTLVKGTVTQPSWLGTSHKLPADEVLAGTNGIVHVPSVIAGTGTVTAATPAFFNSMALDYEINLSAPSPTNWLQFLNELWPTDKESIQALQEWFGYCLLPNTSLQKMLFLLGPPRSGKGTIARVLRSLIGHDNVAGPTLGSLTTQFGLWPLIGKALAIISDARLSARADQGAMVELILTITGEDALTIDRKNRQPVTMKLPTRLMLISNELPRLSDASKALVSRMILLPLTNSWLGKEDTGLFDRLKAELPGILLWAIEGLKTLRQRGRFLQPASGQSMLDQLDELSSPISTFIKECCNVSPEKQVFKRDMYSAWRAWCEDRGHKPGNDATFGKDLAAAYPQITTLRLGEGKRQRIYKGVEVRRDAPLQLSGAIV